MARLNWLNNVRAGQGVNWNSLPTSKKKALDPGLGAEQTPIELRRAQLGNVLPGSKKAPPALRRIPKADASRPPGYSMSRDEAIRRGLYAPPKSDASRHQAYINSMNEVIRKGSYRPTYTPATKKMSWLERLQDEGSSAALGASLAGSMFGGSAWTGGVPGVTAQQGDLAAGQTPFAPSVPGTEGYAEMPFVEDVVGAVGVVPNWLMETALGYGLDDAQGKTNELEWLGERMFPDMGNVTGGRGGLRPAEAQGGPNDLEWLKEIMFPNMEDVTGGRSLLPADTLEADEQKFDIHPEAVTESMSKILEMYKKAKLAKYYQDLLSQYYEPLDYSGGGGYYDYPDSGWYTGGDGGGYTPYEDNESFWLNLARWNI